MVPPPVDPDVTRAHTLPGSVWADPAQWREILDKVLARSWHLLAHDAELTQGALLPRALLPGSLDEPVLLTRSDTTRVCSNVCTHRGALLVDAPAVGVGSIRCRYHGRRFGLDGRLLAAPGFEGAQDFPAARDDLPAVPHARWGPLHFASVDPAIPFERLRGPMRDKLDFYGLDDLVLDPLRSRTYTVDAHFGLYVENYLEGFHVPFVHPGLARSLDVSTYRTEAWEWSSLQTGFAAPGAPTLDLPAGHPDAGRAVAAYYAFLFPCTMLNFYPWGLSINVVEPRGPTQTAVRFLSYVRPGGPGADPDLHTIELEDEAVVTSVQRGVGARLYRGGRFAPRHEQAVHQFERALQGLLALPT